MPKQIGDVYHVAQDFEVLSDLTFCLNNFAKHRERAQEVINGHSQTIFRIPVYVSTNMTSTMGYARYFPKREIALHPALFDKDEPIEIQAELIPTFLHEVAHQIAHLIEREKGHGLMWKHAMLLLGLKPERCYPAGIDLRSYRKRQSIRELGFDVQDFITK